MTNTNTAQTTEYRGFDEIVKGRLYVGGDPCYTGNITDDVAFLNENVDVVIDCRAAGEKAGGWHLLRDLKVPVVHANMYDDGGNSNDPQDFIRAAQAISRLGIKPGKGRYFVHCHMGINRGPSMAMYLLMIGACGPQKSAQGAFMLLRSQRPGVGIAYAKEAVTAALRTNGVPVSERGAAYNKFARFEKGYWTTTKRTTINNRIHRNRRHIPTDARIMVDDYGTFHVTNPSITKKGNAK